MREVLFTDKDWSLIRVPAWWDPRHKVIHFMHDTCKQEVAFRLQHRKHYACVACRNTVPDNMIALFVLYTEGMK